MPDEVRLTLTRPPAVLPWLGISTFVGLAIPIGLLWGEDAAPEVFITFGVAGGTLGFGLAILVLPFIRLKGRREPTLVVTAHAVSRGDRTVRLDRPHRALVRRSFRVTHLSLAQDPAGPRLDLRLASDMDVPEGWPVLPTDERPEPWAKRQLEAPAGRKAAAALAAALARHRDHNVLSSRCGFIPFDRPAGAPVGHLVEESLAEEDEGGDGAFRRGATADGRADDTAALLASAGWHDERLGVTPEWVLLREGERVLLFPVGHTRLGSDPQGRPRLETRDPNGSPVNHPVALDDPDVREVFRWWLGQQVERPSVTERGGSSAPRPARSRPGSRR